MKSRAARCESESFVENEKRSNHQYDLSAKRMLMVLVDLMGCSAINLAA
jgi:hypothetical protein